MVFSASCKASGETKAKFTALFSGGDASFSRYRYVRLYIEVDGERKDEFIIRSSRRGGSSSSFSETITGLNPGTRYFWAVRLGYDSDPGIAWLDITDNGYFTTQGNSGGSGGGGSGGGGSGGGSDVEPWDWFKSNGDASADQTESAYYAVKNKGKTNAFSYLVWNDLVRKVNELVKVSGGTWSSDYAGLSGTKMSSSDRTMTAVRFNSLRHNMGRFRSLDSGIPEVEKGGTVFGKYFTNITDEINSWIDSL